MSLLGRLRGRGAGARGAGPRAGAAGRDGAAEGEDLFDEAFQRRLESLALAARRLQRGRQRGERRSRKLGAGVEFADHRDYVPGDDIRYLDWSVYQRLGRRLVRLYEEEEDLSVHLLLDTSASMAFGSPPRLRFAKQLCAALAYVALGNLDRVSVVAVTDRPAARLEPTRGKRRILRVFEFLRPLRAEGATRLEQAARRFVAEHRRPGLVILLSDLYDAEGLERALRALRYAGHEVAAVHLLDPADETPDLSGDLLLVDAETGARLELTATPAALRAYRSAWRRWREGVERLCVERQVRYAPVRLGTPFDEAVLALLRRGLLVR